MIFKNAPFNSLVALIFGGLCIFEVSAKPNHQVRPNIVFMLADDMGWNQPGFNGGKKELTPNIDKFAGSSMSLTHYYTHSVCAPTRGAFLTGRYSFRNWMDWRSEDFGKPSYLKALGDRKSVV